MTPEREAKERELFETYAICTSLPSYPTYWHTWKRRAEIAAETDAENVRLRKALAAYGKHIASCNFATAYGYFPSAARKCTCGLEAALAPKGAMV